MPLFKTIASIIIAIISLCLVIISQAVKQCIIAQLPYRHTVLTSNNTTYYCEFSVRLNQIAATCAISISNVRQKQKIVHDTKYW